MADKNLLTRISLKIDTWANWSNESVAGQGANLVLKRGEVGFVQIGNDIPPITGTDGTALITNPNTVMFKVGDGVTAFKNLNWSSALAADVYDWAKKPQDEFETYIKQLISDAITSGGVNLSNYVKTTDFDIYKTEVTSAISTAKSGAETTAKDYTDGQVTTLTNGVIKTAQETADAAATAAANAKSAADAAQSSADTANDAISKLNGTTDATSVTKKVTEAVNAAKTELKGTSKDTAENETIAGAKKYADSAVATAKSALTNTINGVSAVANQNKTDLAALTTTVANNKTAAETATNKVASDLSDEVQARKDADAALLGTAGTSGNTIMSAKADAAAAKQAADDAQADADTANTAISVLNGTGAGSVSKAVSDAKTELIGKASDKEDADTIKGAKAYADKKVADLVGTAPEALDTIQELAAALDDNADIVDTLETAIGKKADTTAVNAIDTRVQALEAIDHDHSNKSVLDDITAQKVNNWDDAHTKKHTHANIDELNKIADGDKAKWDAYATSKANQSDLDALESRVDTIEGDYLKAADYFYIDCGSSTTQVN